MKKKKIISIAVFAVGMVTLVVGVVFLVLGLLRGAAMQDGEYLVSAGEWVLDNPNCTEEDCAGKVIWKFTEVGKGTLTTNGHVDDYDFIWSLLDGKLLIETDWKYQLENEYSYEVDQGSGVLTLTDDGGAAYKFVLQQ